MDAVVALWRDCGLLVPWNDPHDDIVRCRATASAALFVGEIDGAIVATAMAGDDGHRGWLYFVAVAPERRRGGLGRAMVRHAEAWLVARGVPKVELMIRATNAAVAGFYRDLGYGAKDRVVMDRWLIPPPAEDRG